MRLRALLASALMLGALACNPPGVEQSSDSLSDGAAGRIQGQVVVQSHARGNVVLFLFRADAPPPPEGSGRPVSFAVVPREQLFGSASHDPSSAGPFVASFQFSLVPSGGPYLLRGFIDADTCVGASGPCHGSDFIPWYGVTDEPNAGDVGGAAVDPETGAELTFSIGDTAPLVAHPTVLFSDTAKLPIDRPMFSVEGDGTFDPAAGSKVLTLDPASLEQDPVHQANPAFVVQYVDDNHDGKPDDANADGVPDFWPKVFVRKLADSGAPLAAENDVDHNGVPDAVVLAAGFDPAPVIAALTDGSGAPRMTPAFVPSLRLVIRPLALDAIDPSAPKPLPAVPKGRYAIILVEPTGQTWQLPNELEPGFAQLIGVPDLGLPELATQSFVVTVP